MKANSTKGKSRAPDGADGPSNEPKHLSVLLVYDDLQAGKLAQNAYQQLAAHLSQHFLFQSQMWKFDLLEFAKLRELAAEDARLANVVMIVTRAAGELPDGVREWFKIWTGQAAPARSRLLFALFSHADEDLEHPAGVQPYLEELARRNHFAFLSQTIQCEEDADLNPAMEIIEEKAELVVKLLLEKIADPAPALSPEHPAGIPTV